MRRTIFEPEHEDFRESVRGFLTQGGRAAHRRVGGRRASSTATSGARRRRRATSPSPRRRSSAALGVEDFRFNAIIDEEVRLHRRRSSDNFALVNDIVAPYLLELTNDEQRARWLPGVDVGRDACR